MRHFALQCTASSAAMLLASAANAQSATPVMRAVQIAPTAAQKLAVVVPRIEQASDVVRITQAGAAPTLPGTVLMQTADPVTSIQQLPVERELSLPEIASTRSLKLGSSTVDLSAMLQNQGALPNVARRLENAPSAVSVKSVEVNAYVVPQGLIVRSFLNYQIKPGTCSDANRRGQIEAAGIRCSRKLSEGERVADYSNPNSARFVEDPAKRAEAITKARSAWAAEDADTATQLANFRAILANPAERQKVEAVLGAEETARVEKLSNDELAGELISSAETKIEDVMFIPKDDQVDRAVQDVAVSDGATMPAAGVTGGNRVRDLAGNLRNRLTVLEPMTPVENQPINKVVFLTGFTLGRQYEWSKRIEKTINWCWVGCSVTYYAGARAGFSYGFGLRFPIVVDATYRRESDGSGQRGFLTASMTPVDGTPEQYAAAGLASSQIFNGQEFVAELQASAGYDYKLPLIGEDHRTLAVGYDLADKLPAPYARGQFKPPMPGTASGEIPFVLNSVDLLAGYGNWGSAGILVHPAVKVGLRSDALRLTLHDNIAGSDQLIINGNSLPLAVDAAQNASKFWIGSPVYNLGFIVTPGVDAKAFIDVGVWSDSWDFPVWFPAVAVTLPPGGVDFACHSGTVCRRDYVYTAGARTNPLDGAATVGDLTVKSDDAPQVQDPVRGLRDGLRVKQRVNVGPNVPAEPKPQDPPPVPQ